MSYVEIPTRFDLPWYTETVELNGVQFRLEFAYNIREARWYLSIQDAGANYLVAGMPLVVDYAINYRFKIATLPDGLIIPADGTGSHREMTEEDLGDRVKLVFIPTEDL